MAKLDTLAKLIAEILAAVTVAGPSGVELFLKLESLLNLGPDEQANVAAAIKAGLAADAETIAAGSMETTGGSVRTNILRIAFRTSKLKPTRPLRSSSPVSSSPAP